MTDVKIEKTVDGREIHFYRHMTQIGIAVPRFCTYCGSERLTDGSISRYIDGGIRCKNCGMYIHDCCSSNDYDDFMQFMEKRKKEMEKND